MNLCYVLYQSLNTVFCVMGVYESREDAIKDMEKDYNHWLNNSCFDKDVYSEIRSDYAFFAGTYEFGVKYRRMKIMIYKISEAAKAMGVCVKTLRRWDREGLFTAHRTPTNQRFYTSEQIDRYLKGDAYVR